MNEVPIWWAVVPQAVVNMILCIGFYHWGFHLGKKADNRGR